MVVIGSATRAYALSELHTTVKYVTQEAVYVDAGSATGVAVGDRGDVIRGGQVIASIEVIFVAERSSSCRINQTTSVIVAGDEVILRVSDAPIPDLTDSLFRYGQEPQLDSPRGVSTVRRPERIHGRLSAQFISWDDLDENGSDSREPSLAANARWERMGGSFYTIYLNARMRKVELERERGVLASEWNNRVYELSLLYDDPAAPVSYRAGRFIPIAVSAAGYLDGAWLNYRYHQDSKFAVFAGFEPDPANTGFRTEKKKFGVSAQLDRELAGRRSLRAAGALAGLYEGGRTMREFFYEQITYSAARRLVAGQSATLNLNRGELKSAEGNALKLTDFITNISWTPIRKISLSGGYDNHRNFRTEDPASLADSLFDDAARQGVRGQIVVRPRSDAQVSFGGTARSIGSDFSAGRTVAIGAGMNGLGNSAIYWQADWTSYKNEYSTGTRPTLRVGNRFGRSFGAAVGVGRDEYDLKDEAQTVTVDWLRVEGDFRVSRHWYGSLSGEFRRGDFSDSNRYFIEAGYRF